jgi:DAACS family dicarboxylate/amino acid:cation (Na+ or H+) symporter
MVVIPLILSTLSLGVSGLGSLRQLGRIGVLTLICFLALTLLSTAVGLLLMNGFAPGLGLPVDDKNQLLGAYRDQAASAMGLSSSSFGIDLLVKIVPRNPIKAAADGDMLAIIFVALVIGVALTTLPKEKSEPLTRLLDSVALLTTAIIEMVMRVAPVGVFCLVFSVTARFGFGLLYNLLAFVLVVLTGLILFQFVGYSLVLRLLTRQRPVAFFRQIKLIMITAFTTSSSNATLPTTMRVAEREVGLSKEIVSFVLPLGATMNMNGTALFEGATVLFLAQCFGVELSLGAQVVVIVMAVLTAIGTAGIPGGSIPLLMMVLGMVGVPMEAIAIVLGIDRILDMCRTVLNVTGDMVTATVVMRFEPGASSDPVAKEVEHG